MPEKPTLLQHKAKKPSRSPRRRSDVLRFEPTTSAPLHSSSLLCECCSLALLSANFSVLAAILFTLKGNEDFVHFPVTSPVVFLCNWCAPPSNSSRSNPKSPKVTQSLSTFMQMGIHANASIFLRHVSSDNAAPPIASASSNSRALHIRTLAGVVADGVSSAETSNFSGALLCPVASHLRSCEYAVLSCESMLCALLCCAVPSNLACAYMNCTKKGCMRLPSELLPSSLCYCSSAQSRLHARLYNVVSCVLCHTSKFCLLFTSLLDHYF